MGRSGIQGHKKGGGGEARKVVWSIYVLGLIIDMVSN